LLDKLDFTRLPDNQADENVLSAFSPQSMTADTAQLPESWTFDGKPPPWHVVSILANVTFVTSRHAHGTKVRWQVAVENCQAEAKQKAVWRGASPRQNHD
jgi:hypothetical protein